MAMAATKVSLLLGTVWPGVKKGAARVKVRKMVLDTNLNMVIILKTFRKSRSYE